MANKGKVKQSHSSSGSQGDDHDSSCDSCDSEQVEQQVKKKIKALPTLKEKVQAIAINGYLLEKRRLDKELEAEIEQVQLKFRQRYQPFLDEISNIIKGQYQFSDADFSEVGELLTEQEQQTKHNYFNKDKIPQYWLKVLKNCDQIGEEIHERDEPLLKHLQAIESVKTADLKTLTVKFYFSQNEWFSNQVLTKQFQLDGDTIKKSYGDHVVWKQGKNITVKIVKKKNKKKGGERKTKQVKEESFFNLFYDIEINSDDEDDDNKDNEQDIADLEKQYQIAQTIYENVLPKSLEYYLGIVETMADYAGLEDEDDDEDKDDQPKKSKSKGKK